MKKYILYTLMICTLTLIISTQAHESQVFYIPITNLSEQEVDVQKPLTTSEKVKKVAQALASGALGVGVGFLNEQAIYANIPLGQSELRFLIRLISVLGIDRLLFSLQKTRGKSFDRLNKALFSIGLSMVITASINHRHQSTLMQSWIPWKNKPLLDILMWLACTNNNCRLFFDIITGRL